MPESVTGIILAGGRSTRMGQDKALIQREGQPLLRHTCEVAQACAEEVLVVTPWGDRYQDIIPPGCRLVAEVESEPSNPEAPEATHGPLLGFAQGMVQVRTEWALLLACDLPRLDTVMLKGWVNRLGNVPATAIALLPRHAKGWEPLCGFYRQSCLPSLEQWIQRGGRSFQRWLAEEQVEPLSVADPSVLFNCNTPEDLDFLH